MTISEDLITSGEVTENDAETVKVTVEHIIKKVALDSNLHRFYAMNLNVIDSRAQNWTPYVKDENDNNIPNPISSIQAVKNFAKQRLAWDAERLLGMKISQEAEAQKNLALAQQKAALL